MAYAIACAIAFLFGAACGVFVTALMAGAREE